MLCTRAVGGAGEVGVLTHQLTLFITRLYRGLNVRLRDETKGSDRVDGFGYSSKMKNNKSDGAIFNV